MDGRVEGRRARAEGVRNAVDAPVEQRGHGQGDTKGERGHERLKYMCYLYFFVPFVSVS